MLAGAAGRSGYHRSWDSKCVCASPLQGHAVSFPAHKPAVKPALGEDDMVGGHISAVEAGENGAAVRGGSRLSNRMRNSMRRHCFVPTGLLMLMVGSSAMVPRSSALAIASASQRARSSLCGARSSGGLVPALEEQNGNRLCASREETTRTGIGPAAAAASEGALRLRGGDAGGSTAAEHAASPNGAKSYKQVAAAGLDVRTNGEKDGNGGAEDASHLGDETGRNGDAGQTKLVLQVDELKLEALRKLGQSLRLGGRGTARRKFKVVRKAGKMDDVKYQNALRKAGLNPVGEVEKVQVYHEDGTIWTYQNPRLHSNPQAAQFCIQGKYEETKPTPETEAQIAAREFDQLSDIDKLRRLAQAEVPAKVGENSAKSTPEEVLAGDVAASPKEVSEGGGEEAQAAKPGDADTPEDGVALVGGGHSEVGEQAAEDAAQVGEGSTA